MGKRGNCHWDIGSVGQWEVPAAGGGAAAVCPVQLLGRLPAVENPRSDRKQHHHHCRFYFLKPRLCRSSYPLGHLADSFGLKGVFLDGVLLFAVVYFLFASAGSTVLLFAAFFLYGLYAAATQGIAMAWITNLAGGSDAATAVGFYTAFQSLCALLASTGAGLVWTVWGSGPPLG